jgi:SOS-response transcriptional repressor LexA
MSLPSDPRDLKQSGFKSGASEYIQHVLSLDQRFNPHPETAHYLRVKGDSLRRLGIKAGDLVLVDTARLPPVGALAVFEEEGRLRVRKAGEGERAWGTVAALVREMHNEEG